MARLGDQASAHPVTAHEKECAFAALALLIERAKKEKNKNELKKLRQHYREIENELTE